MNMKRKANLFLSISLLTLVASSCKKDNHGPSVPNYTVPTTYSFSNVNLTTTNVLLAMADQIGARINLANTIPGTAVSAQDLKNMFNNTGNLFNDSSLKLNASGISLAAYCPASLKADLLNYFD